MSPDTNERCWYPGCEEEMTVPHEDGDDWGVCEGHANPTDWSVAYREYLDCEMDFDEDLKVRVRLDK